MRVIIYPEPGEEWIAPMRNQWEQSGVELTRKLKEAGYEVIPDHDLKEKPRPNDLAIYFDAMLREENVYLHKRSLYVSLEPPCVNPRFYDRIKDLPFDRVLTFSRPHCDGKRIHYSPFPITKYDLPDPMPERTGKICAITANRKNDHPRQMYGVRRELYKALGNDLDLFGMGWTHADGNYKGPVKNIFDIYLKYDTAIVIENQYIEGYASEKYWTPLQAGCRLIHIGWVPDYDLHAASDGYSDGVVKHLQEIS